MRTKSLSSFTRSLARTIRKRGPEILVGLGIAGMFTAIGLAVSETPKATDLIEEKKELENKEELTPKEVIATTWKCYIPTVIMGITSASCIIFSSSINHRRNLALTTAYTLSETAFSEYTAKVAEKIGVKKEKEIRDAIAKDHIEQAPANDSPIIVSGTGVIKCYDVYNDRYFDSNIDIIKRGINKINFNMNRDGYASLNDLYYEIGANVIPYGDDLGWSLSKGLVDVHFSSILTESGVPCLAISFETPPIYDYNMR